MLDIEDAKLLDAWKLLESNGLGDEWKEGSTLSATEVTPSERFKDLVTIEDSGVDVEIRLGWLPIATISEDRGEWFITVRNKEITSVQGSKEEALDLLFNYLQGEAE
jgi:hypothetical protein